MPSFLLKTTHGLISINDTALKNDKPALLLLHGNSSSSKQFRHIFDSPTISQQWRIVTFDLPGHGSSSNAPDVKKTYSQRGYAHLAVHILEHLNIDSVAILGWSLGGSVGIEMLSLLGHRDAVLVDQPPKISVKGLMLVGTAPALGADQIARAYKNLDDYYSRSSSAVTDGNEQTEPFLLSSVAAGKEDDSEPWVLEDAKRTDGRARILIADAATGTQHVPPKGCDQKAVVEGTDVLIAVVNGSEEPFVNLDYLDKEVKWKRIWKGECVRLEGLGHAPFWEDPDRFEGVLREFLRDCDK
jgi:pimeloyl-ACP methyl ester carboxylesterase